MPSFSRLAGRIKAGIKAGIKATENVASIRPITPSMFADAKEMVEQGFTFGDLGANAVARFTNMATSPPAAQNLLVGGIGMAYGQNPVAAIGANVAGNYASRVVGNGLRSRFGEKSMLAGAGENLANLGVSIVGGNILGGMLQSSPETEDRQQIQMVQSQLTAPSAGGSRQFADLSAAQGAYQAPGRMESIPRFADGDAASMVGLPPLDAATADKLRKRAIESAQQGYFLSGELTNYMDGLK